MIWGYHYFRKHPYATMIPTKRRPKFLNFRAVPIMVFPFQSRFRFIFMDHPGILPRTCTNTCGGLSRLSQKEDGIAIHQPSMFGASQYKYRICFACLQPRSLLLQMYSDSFSAGLLRILFCEPILLDEQSARAVLRPCRQHEIQGCSVDDEQPPAEAMSWIGLGLVFYQQAFWQEMLPKVLRKDDCSCLARHRSIGSMSWVCVRVCVLLIGTLVISTCQCEQKNQDLPM